MDLLNRAERVALRSTKRKRNKEQLNWKGRRHLPSWERYSQIQV